MMAEQDNVIIIPAQVLEEQIIVPEAAPIEQMPPV